MLSLPTKYTHTRIQGKFLEVMGMFSTLVVVSKMYAYVQTDQDVFIKCIQFFV